MLCSYRRYGARSVAEISDEIAAVVRRINGINSSLNVREVIAEVLSRELLSPEGRAESVSGLYKYASEMLDELRELYRTLDVLKLELSASLDAESRSSLTYALGGGVNE